MQALVYVDEKRLGEGKAWPEYVARMNRGIRDAVAKGMEGGYVEGVLRPFVPEPTKGEGEEGEIEDPFHPGVVRGANG